MSMKTNNTEEYFVKDFYKRTLEILQKTETEYDVALLINSTVGLLTVPKERFFNNQAIDENLIDSELLGRMRSTFKLSLSQIVRHLRNSICHGNMEIIAEKSNIENGQAEIYSVVFKDKSGFSADVPVELLREFLISFATNVCNDAEKKEKARK